MNSFMIKRLILKDWYLYRSPIIGYFVVGLIAIGIVAWGGGMAFNIGSILLITVIIALGMHLAIGTTVAEHSEHTLPFVMSLPISITDYTAAKLLGNLLIYLVPWTLLLASACLLLKFGNASGVIPFAVLTLIELFASYSLTLAIALVSESMTWTIVVTVICNLFLQGYLYFVSHIPTIAESIKGPTAVWSHAVVTLLVAQLAIIVAGFSLAFFMQSRKTDFT
jgi:ABC-2 type transport system permease protein